MPPRLPKGFTLPPEPPGPDWKAQILARGWGYVVYDPLSVQPDNGVGLTHGIIGQIGRASCRERVCQYGSLSVAAVSLRKKEHEVKRTGSEFHNECVSMRATIKQTAI